MPSQSLFRLARAHLVLALDVEHRRSRGVELPVTCSFAREPLQLTRPSRELPGTRTIYRHIFFVGRCSVAIARGSAHIRKKRDRHIASGRPRAD